MSANRAQVVVHLGPEKTGTTALAEYFTVLAARGELDSQIIFPTGHLWFDRDDRIQKHNVELRAMGESLLNGGLTSEQDAALSRLRAAAIAHPGLQPTVVLIFELGLVASSPELLTACLLNYFDTVTFVVAARHQDTAIRSLISQRVSSLDDPASNLDVASYLDSGSVSFTSVDYALVSRQWAGSDSRVRLIFIPFFESDPGSMQLIRRFCSATGLPEAVEGRRVQGRRIHPSFSEAGLKRLASLKRGIHRWRRISLVRDRLLTRFKREWKDFHSSAMRGQIEPNGRMYEPWSLSAHDLEWVRLRYEESNRDFLANLDRKGYEKEWERWERELA